LRVDDGGWAIGSTGNGWADNFNGRIDEVAIYDRALAPAQVQAHYAAGASGELVTLTLTRAGDGKLTLSWSVGTLQYSDVLPAVSWAPVTGAVPPFTVTPAATGNVFYRVQVP